MNRVVTLILKYLNLVSVLKPLTASGLVDSAMYEIKDKVFLITGGAAGIGAGVVRAVLDEGAKYVAILDVDVNSGKALEEELTQKHGQDRVKFYKCDVTSNELNVVYDDVLKSCGYIDVVINNAGILNDSPTMYEKQIAVNVTAAITSSFNALNLMRKDRGGKGGTILNISSIVGLYQSRLCPVYCATKSAVLQFSNCLGMEPHYSRTGVRVVTMCFGCTDTSLFSSAKMSMFDKETDKVMSAALEKVPFQKTESAVAGLIYAYKHGASASTWLVTTDRPAQDITANVTQAYAIMSQGVFD